MPDKYEQGQNDPALLAAHNLANPRNSDRAILQRIEHKLDTIFAMLQTRSVTDALPENKKVL